MKHVYFLRHGETVCNQAKIVQDAHDTLTDAGKLQAIKVAERLHSISFSHLLVSDYDRTRQTVEPLAALTTVVPEYSPLFREVRRPSEFFGTSSVSPEYVQFRETAALNFEDASWHHSDEENFADLEARVREAIERILSLEGDVVVVSHGLFIRFITLTLLFGESFTPALWRTAQYKLLTSNTGITSFTYDGEWKLLTFNDHAHFAE